MLPYAEAFCRKTIADIMAYNGRYSHGEAVRNEGETDAPEPGRSVDECERRGRYGKHLGK